MVMLLFSIRKGETTHKPRKEWVLRTNPAEHDWLLVNSGACRADAAKRLRDLAATCCTSRNTCGEQRCVSDDPPVCYGVIIEKWWIVGRTVHRGASVGTRKRIPLKSQHLIRSRDNERSLSPFHRFGHIDQHWRIWSQAQAPCRR